MYLPHYVYFLGLQDIAIRCKLNIGVTKLIKMPERKTDVTKPSFLKYHLRSNSKLAKLSRLNL